MDNITEIIQNEIDALENNPVETIEPVKRKRGRPKKSENVNNVTKENNNISLIPISGIVNILLDKFKLTTLSEFESNSLDDAFTKVLNKYIELNYSEEINLTLIVLIILSSRYNEYKKSKLNTRENGNREKLSNKEELKSVPANDNN